MAKNSIRDFDATSGNNTDIQSVDISEGCAASGINNAIRELMVDLKNVSTGAVNLETPAADSLTVAGDLTVDTNTLKVDSSNNRVGVGTASPGAGLTLEGTKDTLASQLKVTATGVVSQYLGGGDNVGLAIGHDHASLPIVFKTGVTAGTGVTGSGTERMRIDANGVGIGTSPSYKLHSTTSTGSDYAGYFHNSAGSGNGTSLVARGGANNATPNFQVQDFNGNADFTVTGTGSVGIGTSSPAVEAHIQTSSGNPELRIESTGANYASMSLKNSSRTYSTQIRTDQNNAYTIRDENAGANRFLIDTSGRVMINTTGANSAQLTTVTSATGEFAADLRSTSSSYTSIVCLLGSNTNTTNSTYDHLRCDIHGVAQKLAIRDSGNVVNANNSYGSLSDSRMKENIVDAASQWDDIKALQVRKYNRIGETQKELGVIAQELEASGMGGLVEEARYYDVNNNPDEETRKSVKYSVLYMKAVKALQEAMNRIETLETEMTALKARVTALEA